MTTSVSETMSCAPDEADVRPWPVVLLTALGAWLSALPLVLMAGLLLGDIATRGLGPYGCGLLVLIGGLVVCRSREVPLFVEQLAVPALLVGGGLLGLGLYRDLGDGPASLALGAMALLVARLLPQAWLRVVLGGTAAGFMLAGTMVVEAAPGTSSAWAGWMGLQLLLMVWALAWAYAGLLSRGLPAGAPDGQVTPLEAIATGWLLATLCGLAWWSGMTFLVGGAVGLHGGGSGMSWAVPQAGLMQAASAALALAAAGLVARRWPLMRQPAVATALVVLAALAWWLPTLGAAALVLALMATSHRWRLAAAATLAIAWIIGSFYYQLQWPLSVKALWLLGSGAALGALAGWMHLTSPDGHAARPVTTPQGASGMRLSTAPRGRAAALVLATLLATLALVNAGIWQKERLITQGQPVFVELAPVDPRSLMQGDYMRLAFRLPDGVLKLDPSLTTRPQVVLRRGADGVSQAVSLRTPGRALAADEVSVQLAPVAGQWVLVTDAWYFREGEAERWAAARYGEFRVMPDGQALLVGLADAQRQPIH